MSVCSLLCTLLQGFPDEQSGAVDQHQCAASPEHDCCARLVKEGYISSIAWIAAFLPHFISRLIALAFCLCCPKTAIMSCYLATVPLARKGSVPVGRDSFNHLANFQRWKQTRPQRDLISTMRPFQVSLLIKSCRNHWAQRGECFFLLEVVVVGMVDVADVCE